MPSFGFLYAGEVWVLLENQMMLLAVFERAALMLMTLFFLTRTRPFQRLFQKRDHTPAELVLVASIFGLFAVFSTYTGDRKSVV